MEQQQMHNDKINKIIKFLQELSSIRIWTKHFNIISTQIYFTANGIKLGYLWDAGPPINSSSLKKLLSKLVKVELIPEALEIFEFCTEILIVNQNKLNILIENNKFLNIPLMDVTKTLDTPQLLDRNYEIVCKIIELIKFILDKKQINKFPAEICVPTVIGLLIGYPVVYWYNPEISDENNLNNSRLKVFQLSHSGSIVYSFSVPYDLINQNTILNQSIKHWLDEKTLYGFKTETFITETGYVIM